MGGNAVQNTIRLEKEDYFNLWEQIDISSFSLYLVRSYHTKESFGDMDLLIPSTYGRNYENYKRLALEDVGLEIVEEVKNGNVTSFGVQLPQGIFQIDVISLDIDTLPFAYHYYGFNDMGNLLGRLARGIGLKLGHQGLWYTQRDEHHVLHNHLLTRDFYEAIEYLGLSADRYQEGFDTMEEVFDFVMSSPYYDWNRFDLAQRNYKARVRDRKRPNYKAFLEYAEGKPYNTLPNKHMYLGMHFKQWPKFEEKYHEILLVQQEDNHIKSKFNGNVVSELTGLTGKELGGLMSRVKSELTREQFLSFDQETMNCYVMSIYREM